MNKLFFTGYIFFVICFFVPSTAHAYLDPGTGNAIVYVILSLAGAAFYFLKGLFYKIVKGEDIKDNQYGTEHDSIVIFGEAKQYWKVFKPVVEKLIEQKQCFSYYTMDVEDPCLLIDNPYMKNRYIGSGNSAYVKIGNLKANLVLSTTPNIGTEGYPIPRSNGIKKLVHVFHAFTDMAYYHKGSLDHYDSVMLMGEFEIPLIRQLEKMRGLPEKELYPAGLPYMDDLIKKNPNFGKPQIKTEKDRITVLLAPSWGEKGYLKIYGTDFIEKLAQKNFNLILRPHPQSVRVEQDMLHEVEEKLKKYDNVTWDLDQDGTPSFQAADILVSDTSMIRLDFSLVYHRPFITIPIAKEGLSDFEIADLGYSWTDEAVKSIGYTLQDGEIDHLDEIIMKVLREKTDEVITKFQNENVYNIGTSGEVIADYLIENNKAMQTEKEEDK